MTRSLARRVSGFTLIEMLVVLMIAGMALALAYQSLSQWRLASERLTATSGALREQRLAQAWFEDSIRGMTPVAERPFEGSADAFSATTLAASYGPPGVPTVIGWSIERTGTAASLVLVEAGHRLALPLAEGTSAAFVYIDRDGASHDRWPPATGVADDLPASVAVVEYAAGGTVWLATVKGVLIPPLIPPMFEPDSD